MSNQCGNKYNEIFYDGLTYLEMREIIDNYVPANYWKCDTCGNTWSDNLAVCVKCGETDGNEQLKQPKEKA